MGTKKRGWKLGGLLSLLLVIGLLVISPNAATATDKVGVLFVVHGGFDEYKDQYLWDAGVQQFSYEPLHSVYKMVIWCPGFWGSVVSGNPKEVRKYAAEYDRLGGTDPFNSITQQQMSAMIAEINKYACGVTFEYDWASWVNGQDVSHYPYPRFIYNGPPGWAGVSCATHTNCTYCGESEPGATGPWPGCDPNRYNVDGPVERLLKKGISRLIMIDLTVGGVRFTKTYNVYTMTKRALADNGAATMPVLWINDYKNLMQQSYPTDPANWTPQWSYVNKKGPNVDPKIPLAGNPNPIAEDPELTLLNVEGIEAGFNPGVTDDKTAVLILNHALFDWTEYFDPKIDDTLTITEGIKTQLLARHPTLDPNNIVGAYMGIREDGTAEGCSKLEYTRNMRGEDLGYGWLYESNKSLPALPWGYLYWDALQYLKNRGVKHIVIGFPQIVSDSVLNLVEIPNQIAKEIGFKTWLQWGTPDYVTYPGIGHPFFDYWGNWVDTTGTGAPFCFTMGGCGSTPYPPPRQACARGNTDPSLAFDVSEYGHLGYDPALGAPNPNAPVQNQYTGTWEMYRPASANPRLGQMLARHILSEFTCASTTTTTIQSTVITLADFRAIPGSGKVTLVWTTAAEFDTAGFNIYRSTEENGAYEKINSALIKSTGSPGAGAAYRFVDTAARNRTTYWYKLEDIDLSGKTTMHGPISATPKLLNIFK
jgi:hypothetical protein